VVIAWDGIRPSGKHPPKPVAPPPMSTQSPSAMGTEMAVDTQNPNAAADAAMNRYASGDAAAFSELYDLLAPRLFGFLLRSTRDRCQAEDLLQQTLLKMHCARGRFVPGAEVVPWAFSIARRLVIDAARRSKVRGAQIGGDDQRDAIAHLAALDLPVDEAIHSKQIMHLIQRELDRLPEANRRAFQLVKQEGLTHAEAAEVLGTTVTAVKLRAHRTYVALRTALQPSLAARDT
jgi:RNA polymerase sigma-70 factor, ECF subfamily